MTHKQHAKINDTDCSLIYTVSPNFRTLDFHAHDEYEILYFLAGEVQYYIEDKSYYLMPGDILLIPPGKLHRPVIIDENITYERMVLMLSQTYSRRLLERVPEAFVWRGISPYRIVMGEQDGADFNRILEKLLHLSCDDAGMLMRDSYCTLILLQLNRFIEQAPREEAAPQVRIQQVIHYINAHFTEPVSLEDIAKRFYMSKYHLLRQFKTYTNSTVHNYILTKRILLAKALLKQGIGPKEASVTCGFGSYAGFYQAFTQSTGVNPMQFAKDNRG